MRPKSRPKRLTSCLDFNSTQAVTSPTWYPERIKKLRHSRSQTQEEFGLELMDTMPSYAQKRVSELERGIDTPTSAERRTLQRMDEGEI